MTKLLYLFFGLLIGTSTIAQNSDRAIRALEVMTKQMPNNSAQLIAHKSAPSFYTVFIESK